MNNEPKMDVVVFSQAAARYAVESVYVREVQPGIELTPLPCTPSFVAGVINVRGDILAVIDLRIFFGLQAVVAEPPTHVIIVEPADSAFGILADTAPGTDTVFLRELEISHAGPDGLRRFVKGEDGDRFVMLDLPGMAADARLLVNDHVLEKELEPVPV